MWRPSKSLSEILVETDLINFEILVETLYFSYSCGDAKLSFADSCGDSLLSYSCGETTVHYGDSCGDVFYFRFREILVKTTFTFTPLVHHHPK